jgi:hypothetical protein
MTSTFVSSGVRFTVQITSPSLREREAAVVDIQPDKTLWTSAQKRRRGIGPGTGRWKNSHGSGTLLGFVDDEEGIALRRRKHHRGQERASHYYKPKPIEFTDRPQFR